MAVARRAGVGSCRLLSSPSYRHPRESGDPGLHRNMTLKSLDSRLRGNDGVREARRKPPTVIPAKAGIQGFTAA
ncbi:hypothetical protein bcgnr5380_63560 [Bacillus cereus]